MPRYSFRPSAELGWFVLTTIVLAMAQVLLTLEPEQITDWRTWAVSLLGAAVRAGAGALLSYAGSHETQPTDAAPFSEASDNLHGRLLTLAAGVERAQQMGIQLGEADLAVIVDAMLVEAQRLDAEAS